MNSLKQESTESTARQAANKGIALGEMHARVYNQISKTDIVVADMTGRNPNVFCEVGYSHASTFRIPKKREQKRIAKLLLALREKSDQLRRLQREVEAELASFTPALLAKACRRGL